MLSSELVREKQKLLVILRVKRKEDEASSRDRGGRE
jgi:hypothetical protein